MFGAGVTNDSALSAPSNHGICGITPGAGATATTSGDLFVAPGPTVVVTGDDTTFEAWTAPLTFDLASASVVMHPLDPGYLVVASTATDCGSATSNGAGCGGLGITASGLPILGSSDFTLTLGGLVNQPLTLMAFGTAAIAAPGLPLGGGCHALMNFDVGAFALTGPKVFTLPIPNDPGFVGTTLAAQAVELLPSATNPPFRVSNGVSLVLGF